MSDSLKILDEGEYEVLANSVEPRVNARGYGYYLVRCTVQDQGEFFERTLFYAYSPAHREIDKRLPRGQTDVLNWKPRYAIADVIQRPGIEAGQFWTTTRRFILI